MHKSHVAKLFFEKDNFKIVCCKLQNVILMYFILEFCVTNGLYS